MILVGFYKTPHILTYQIKHSPQAKQIISFLKIGSNTNMSAKQTGTKQHDPLEHSPAANQIISFLKIESYTKMSAKQTGAKQHDPPQSYTSLKKQTQQSASHTI